MKTVEKVSKGKLPRFRSGELAPNVMPGMYPVLYLAADVDTGRQLYDPICHDCANSARERGEVVNGYYVHHEGPPEHCAHCGKTVESAYGNPWEDEA